MILDTNVWLYLSNGLDPLSGKHSDDHHFELLEKLKRHTKRKEIKVLVNDLIIEEFKRNKDHSKTYIQKLKNKLKDNDGIFKEIRRFSKSLLVISELEREYQQGVIEKINLNEGHIAEVEKFLLNDCTRIIISDDLKIELVEKAMNRKPPFHNNKNNFADACILYSADRFLAKEEPTGFDKAIFVSNNIQDFCQKDYYNKFHDDISTQLKSKFLTFDRFLPSALHLSTSLLSEMYTFYEQNEESFICISDFCYRDEDYSPHGIFDIKLLKTSENEVFYDPNQLELFTEYPKKVKEPEFANAGHCSFCNSFHVECPKCGELLTDLNSEEKIECPNCEVLFLIHLRKNNIHVLGFRKSDDENSD